MHHVNCVHGSAAFIRMVQDGEAAVGAMEVWVLAGQSNMAGRGSVDALPPDYTPSPRISALNGSGAWIAPAVDPMHVDVDLRKAERCGVGPGLPFARAILDVNRESMHIGLVPCALGESDDNLSPSSRRETKSTAAEGCLTAGMCVVML